MTTQYQRYQALKAEQPKKYARDLAGLLGISEAELTHARTLDDAVALRPDFSELLKSLEAVGETKSITRNAYAVHEQVGRYENLHLGGHAGLILNPRALDQRLFPSQWKSAFALTEKSERGDRHSMQIFDAHGDAVLKIYATANTNMAAWHSLVALFTLAETPELNVTPAVPLSYASQPDAAAIEREWRAMTDVHQFFGLLKRHNISRQQAFRSVASDLALKVDNSTLSELLKLAQADGNEIMIFIGNRGCVQIFTGVVEKLMPMESWINIFNPTFTLHLMEHSINESWITRKPTANGMVTSLELFAADGTQIAQLYGQRTEGEAEQTRWREQLAALTGAGEAA
ncbi:ChuX/HutX family heme-like substrate-binding protein [Erwinia sp. MMLR14_017]|uniref:hemin-degrading factor n=1 Tax=Erwinia sp. MMLR14_017 TaxID=3093842 RepID=UPI0029906328|nr:ChuX/HutX family heme-like substrate-binding protein [Erwinia sp. MMLR14_017]MDW8845510.1 ChuX/HutX family heme-like substrate-binding protein [Erwinia sp. MMLR14_017]